MNNYYIENEIVKKYIIKSKQERILWELQNPKKREFVVWKNFPGIKLFKQNCLKRQEYMTREELKKYLSQLKKGEKVYYLGESCIGELELTEAVELADRGEICIIYCGNGLGYYQGEQENGAIPRFLLVEEG